MERKAYFLAIIKKYLLSLRSKSKINNFIQEIYNKYEYGCDDIRNEQLLMELQNYNMIQEVPYLATGQNGYFHEQIMSNGLGNFKLNPQDIEDAKYISSCFGKETSYSENNIPITYTTLLGSTEFDYATQSFPAGIYEDVFQCGWDHDFPIRPLVGEKEEDFYLRVLEFQINSKDGFDPSHKQEVLNRGKRLIHNFCCHKNKVYLINFNDIADIKASFGDENGLRNGSMTHEESKQKISELESFSQLLEIFNIDTNMLYNDANMQSDFGIALYGVIPPEKIQFIEVERKYEILQKKAIELGYKIGDIIPQNFIAETNSSFDFDNKEETQEKHL